MLHVVLVEPEIPANTGNIARTCAATGSVLHLIRPLGFDISDKAVKRAGLDYWHLVDVRDYENLDDFFSKNDVRCMRLFSTKAPRRRLPKESRSGLSWLPLMTSTGSFRFDSSTRKSSNSVTASADGTLLS